MPHVSLPGSINLYWEAFGPSATATAAAAKGNKESPMQRCPKVLTAAANQEFVSLGLKPDTSTIDLRYDVPTIILLPPLFADMTYYQKIIDRLAPMYQLVTFDLRSYGKTNGPVNPAYDFFVSAADIAFAMEILGMPPSHVFTAGCTGFQVGLKLCLLFPDQVLSLALVGCGQLFAPPDHREVFAEIDENWYYPTDEGDFFETLGAVSEILLSDYHYKEEEDWVDVRDRLIGTIARRYNPYQLSRTLEVTRPNQVHPCVGPPDLAQVKQPVLLIHGAADKCFRAETVMHELPAHLNSAKELDLHIVEDAPHLVYLTHTEVMLDYWALFLARHTDSTPLPRKLDRPYALRTLATLSRHTQGTITPEELSKRKGDNPIDYSLVSPEAKAATLERILALDKYGAEECNLEFPGLISRIPSDDDSSSEFLDEKVEGWTYSRRHHFEERVPLRRSPLASPVSVCVLTDKFEAL